MSRNEKVKDDKFYTQANAGGTCEIRMRTSEDIQTGLDSVKATYEDFKMCIKGKRVISIKACYGLQWHSIKRTWKWDTAFFNSEFFSSDVDMTLESLYTVAPPFQIAVTVDDFTALEPSDLIRALKASAAAYGGRSEMEALQRGPDFKKLWIGSGPRRGIAIGYAKDDAATYLGIRGTVNAHDVLVDADIRMEVLPGQGTSRVACHAGFLREIDGVLSVDLLRSLLSRGRVVVCGHSLGGALAAIFVLKHRAIFETAILTGRLQCIGFGTPTFLSADASEAFRPIQRSFTFIEAETDPVPVILGHQSVETVACQLAEGEGGPTTEDKIKRLFAAAGTKEVARVLANFIKTQEAHFCVFGMGGILSPTGYQSHDQWKSGRRQRQVGKISLHAHKVEWYAKLIYGAHKADYNIGGKRQLALKAGEQLGVDWAVMQGARFPRGKFELARKSDLVVSPTPDMKQWNLSLRLRKVDVSVHEIGVTYGTEKKIVSVAGDCVRVLDNSFNANDLNWDLEILLKLPLVEQGRTVDVRAHRMDDSPSETRTFEVGEGMSLEGGTVRQLFKKLFSSTFLCGLRAVEHYLSCETIVSDREALQSVRDSRKEELVRKSLEEFKQHVRVHIAELERLPELLPNDVDELAKVYKDAKPEELKDLKDHFKTLNVHYTRCMHFRKVAKTQLNLCVERLQNYVDSFRETNEHITAWCQQGAKPESRGMLKAACESEEQCRRYFCDALRRANSAYTEAYLNYGTTTFLVEYEKAGRMNSWFWWVGAGALAIAGTAAVLASGGAALAAVGPVWGSIVATEVAMGAGALALVGSGALLGTGVVAAIVDHSTGVRELAEAKRMAEIRMTESFKTAMLLTAASVGVEADDLKRYAYKKSAGAEGRPLTLEETLDAFCVIAFDGTGKLKPFQESKEGMPMLDRSKKVLFSMAGAYKDIRERLQKHQDSALSVSRLIVVNGAKNVGKSKVINALGGTAMVGAGLECSTVYPGIYPANFRKAQNRTYTLVDMPGFSDAKAHNSGVGGSGEQSSKDALDETWDQLLPSFADLPSARGCSTLCLFLIPMHCPTDLLTVRVPLTEIARTWGKKLVVIFTRCDQKGETSKQGATDKPEEEYVLARYERESNIVSQSQLFVQSNLITDPGVKFEGSCLFVCCYSNWPDKDRVRSMEFPMNRVVIAEDLPTALQGIAPKGF